MRCPICSAIVTGGDVCESCGATLPANVRSPKAPARRGGLLSSAVKPKRTGTLADFFRPPGTRVPEQSPQRKPQNKPQNKPQRPQREQRPPLGARDVARRAGRYVSDAPSPLPGRAPSPPASVSPPPSYPSVPDPWASTYDAAPFAASRAPMSGPLPAHVPPSPPPAFSDDEDAWEDDPGWGAPSAAAAPTGFDSYDSYESFGGAPGDRQQPRAAAMRGDPYAMGGPALRMPARRRGPTIGGISRMTMNVTMFGIVLLILAVAILVGLRYVGTLQPQVDLTNQPTPTIAPTAVPPGGFSSVQANLFSVAYPTQWTHTAAGDALGCGCSLTGETFGDGADATLVIYTRPAAPSAELAQMLTQAAGSVSPNQTPRIAVLNQQRTYDSQHWMENDYTIAKVVGTKLVQLEVRVLDINFNATTYIVVASAPQSSFDQANSAYFEPMLRSFRFD